MSIDARLTAGKGTAHLTGTTLLDSLRTVMDLSGSIAGLDLRNYVERKDIPAHSLSGTVRLTLEQDAQHVDRHGELRLDSTSTLGDSKLRSATIRFGRDSLGIHVDTADVIGPGWKVEARGQLAAKGMSSSDSITFTASIDSLGALRTLLLDSLGAPIVKALDGKLNVRNGVIRGSFEHASVFADVNGTQLQLGTTRIDTIIGGVDLTDLPTKTAGKFHGVVHGVTEGKLAISYGEVTADLFDGKSARVAGNVTASNDAALVSFGASVTWPDSTYTVLVDSLDAKFREHRWKLAFPATATITTNAVHLDSLVLQSDHKAMVVAAGTIPERGTVDASLQLRSLGFEELAFLGLLPDDLSGVISALAKVTGTRDAPVMTARVTVDSIVTDETKRPKITFDGTYANRQANVALKVLADRDTVLRATGDIPIDLSLRSVEKRLIDAPMSVKVHSDSLSLALLEGLMPRVAGLEGRLTADVDLAGTVGRPRGTGKVTLSNGAFVMQRFGLAASDASALIRLAGDSVIVERLRMTDGQNKSDTASITGLLQLVGDRWIDWTVTARSFANNFRVIDDPRIATADADWNLTVSGELGTPHVKGNVFVPYGVFTIGPQRRPRAPTPRDSVTGTGYGIPNIDGMLVTLGQDVRLKSRDANVQLEGSLELFGEATKPWVSGLVTATRGTYRVNVGGVIKRTFRVDSGSVAVEGTPDMPIGLDVYTSYLVRRPEEDVVIRAHVYGTADRPRLDLSSDLGSATSQSEIISYLVFGQPSFALQQGDQRTLSSAGVGRLSSALAAPAIGGWLESSLGTILPFFSTLQVTSTVNDELSNTIRSSKIDDLLSNYAITGGRQIGSDAFFSLSAGSCSSSGTASGASPIWLGTAVDYRPKRTVGASLSIDPGPSPCTRLGGNYQIGLDFSYDWRFGAKPRKP
jgi:translocation and assembly module TamB